MKRYILVEIDCEREGTSCAFIVQSDLRRSLYDGRIRAVDVTDLPDVEMLF